VRKSCVRTFQFFAARGAHDTVRALAEYVITRRDPDLAANPDRCLGLLGRVAHRARRRWSPSGCWSASSTG